MLAVAARPLLALARGAIAAEAAAVAPRLPLGAAAAGAMLIPQACARAIAPAWHGAGGGCSGCGCCDPAPALRHATAGVVLVRVAGSWATGVAVTERFVVTNAHVLPAASTSNNGSGSGSGGGGGGVAAAPTVWVRLPGGAWAPASVVRAFTGCLDLAVLRLAVPATGGAPPPLQPLELASDDSSCGIGATTPPAGADVFVVGHGLFGPRCGLAPSVTRGSLARAVRLPGSKRAAAAGGGAGGSLSGRASMLIVTAAVHAGASGGALVDARGRLAGVVTSNTRHHSGATLARFAYAVASEELAPLWALLRGAGGGGRNGGDVEMAARLAALDRDDAAGRRLWALQDPSAGADEAASAPVTGGGRGGGGGGGGAAASAASGRIPRQDRGFPLSRL